jgi:hypothetical protein
MTIWKLNLTLRRINMGYTTDFGGDVEVVFKDKVNRDSAAELINGLANTRRVKRDLSKVKEHLPKPWPEYGKEGEFFYPTNDWPWWESFGQSNEDPSVDGYTPPGNQPGTWLQWIAIPLDDDDTKMILEWDGGEKFYEYTDWMKYIIKRIIAPRGGVANGSIEWFGEDRDDIGIIEVKDNKVKEVLGRIVYD